jgi:hypothetical protein
VDISQAILDILTGALIEAMVPLAATVSFGINLTPLAILLRL